MFPKMRLYLPKTDVLCPKCGNVYMDSCDLADTFEYDGNGECELCHYKFSVKYRFALITESLSIKARVNRIIFRLKNMFVKRCW